MKYILLLFSIFVYFYSSAQIKPSLVEIPVSFFVNGGKTDLAKVIKKDDSIREDIKSLFDRREIIHDLTGQDSNFEKYWEAFGSQWYRVQFRDRDKPLLLFMGLNSFSDEREYVEIYDPSRDNSPRLFANPGRLIAYKRHPLTDELILYTHLYPCCRSASHNIFTLRSINGEIKSKDRFFVGRDAGDMVGPFFPDSIQFPSSYEVLEAPATLRWSPEVVQNNAFIERAAENIINVYQKGSIYKVLGHKEDWQYVIMFSGISDEPSPVINPINFKFKGVYGWIKMEH